MKYSTLTTQSSSDACSGQVSFRRKEATSRISVQISMTRMARNARFSRIGSLGRKK